LGLGVIIAAAGLLKRKTNARQGAPSEPERSENYTSRDDDPDKFG